jgi:hypothetical protein
LKTKLQLLEKLAQQKYQRDAFELQCCSREIAQIVSQVEHLRQIGETSEQLNHSQLAYSWLAWRNESISDLNLRLFSLSALLEKNRMKTQKSFGRQNVCKELIKRQNR